MRTPRYVARIARIPEVFETLRARPHGMSLDALAVELGIAPDELREDLMAFYSADDEVLMGLRPDVIEFLGPDGDDEDPNEAEMVRIIDPRPSSELGVEHVDAAELALVYTSARALLDLEPDNADLADAIDALAETMFGDVPVPAADERRWDWALGPLRTAQAGCRRVRILYSRAWHSGVGERVIEPYRLVQTRRGWEVDAGPPDASGTLRTYLLSNVRQVEVLEEVFEPPPDLAALLQEQRVTSTVRLRLPHTARWAADMYAEQVQVVSDDELMATLDLQLLPPLEHRVGVLLLAAGPAASVLAPRDLADAGRRLARELLEHHGLRAGSLGPTTAGQSSER